MNPALYTFYYKNGLDLRTHPYEIFELLNHMSVYPPLVEGTAPRIDLPSTRIGEDEFIDPVVSLYRV